MSPFQSEISLTSSDWYANVTMDGQVIVAINGTKRSIGFNAKDTHNHQSVDLIHMFVEWICCRQPGLMDSSKGQWKWELWQENIFHSLTAPTSISLS
jgi:hypothetical protein